MRFKNDSSKNSITAEAAYQRPAWLNWLFTVVISLVSGVLFPIAVSLLTWIIYPGQQPYNVNQSLQVLPFLICGSLIAVALSFFLPKKRSLAMQITGGVIAALTALAISTIIYALAGFSGLD